MKSHIFILTQGQRDRYLVNWKASGPRKTARRHLLYAFLVPATLHIKRRLLVSFPRRYSGSHASAILFRELRLLSRLAASKSMATLQFAYQDLAGINLSNEQYIALETLSRCMVGEILHELADCTRSSRRLRVVEITDLDPFPLEILKQEAKARALALRGEDADPDGEPSIRVEVSLPQWVRDAIRRAAPREGFGAGGDSADDR